MSVYLALKHLHVACVILTATGFVLRGWLMLRQSPLLETRLARVLPHLNDTLLLAAALGLSALSGQYPFVADWLTAKIFGLLAYIVLGALALKYGRTRRRRFIFWLLALLMLSYIVSVALSRDPRGWFALPWL